MTTESTVAVTGATGQLGRLTLAALQARAPGARLIALVRDPSRAADLGVEVRAFDYTRPESLAPALAGVGTLGLISSSDFNDRAGQHRNVIAAAGAAGVGRIVYTSLLKGAGSPMILAADHVATEAALAASGVAHTVLRNGWYTENYTGSLAGAVAAGAIPGANAAGRVSAATRADYAEGLAAALLDDGLAGQVLELAGDDAFSMAEFAAAVSARVGREIAYAAMPQAAYAELLVSFGLPAGFAALLADSDARAHEGALFDDSRTLSRLIGRPTTPLAAAVAAALA